MQKELTLLYLFSITKKEIDNKVKATVIVPKKDVFKATDRSVVKRRMRNSLLPYLDKLEGLNIALYLKTRITDSNRERVINDFDKEIRVLINNRILSINK